MLNSFQLAEISTDVLESLYQAIKQELSNRQALAIEAQLIYCFGSVYDDKVDGCLLNLADHIRPKFDGEMRRIPNSYLNGVLRRERSTTSRQDGGRRDTYATKY